MNVRTITESKKSIRRIFRPHPHAFHRPAVRLFTAGILFLLFTFPLSAQKPVDYVLLLDNSESMFRQDGSNIELIIRDIMKNRLGFQDRFHLLSFASEPEYEIDRVLRDKESVQEILTHVMMLQPLAEDTDIISALKFLTEYMTELPLNTEKQVLIFSDDIHDPPDNSDYTDPTENNERIDSIASYIRRNGWKVDIVLFEGSGEQIDSSDNTAFLQKGLLSRLAELIGSPAVPFAGDVESFALIPVEESEGTAEDTKDTASSELSSNGAAGFDESEKSNTGKIILLILGFLLIFILLFLLIRRVFGSSGSEKGAPREPSEGPMFGIRSSAERESTSFTRVESDSASILGDAKKRRVGGRETPYGPYQEEKEKGKDELPSSKTADNSGASVLSAFAARERGNREGLSVRLPGKQDGSRSARYKGREGQSAIEMRVDFQKNTFRKNMRWFDDGSSFSIGQAGISDFEISSIDVSGVIATIRKKGEAFRFTPEQPEYFPDVKSPLSDCLNRNIRIVSPDTGFATTIRFHQWLSPLERLNRMLHIIDKPGKPDPDID